MAMKSFRIPIVEKVPDGFQSRHILEISGMRHEIRVENGGLVYEHPDDEGEFRGEWTREMESQVMDWMGYTITGIRERLGMTFEC